MFSWTVQPSADGSAPLTLRLCSVEPTRCPTVANAVSDTAEPLTGEAMKSVRKGLYYVVTLNVSEDWHIKWECRD